MVIGLKNLKKNHNKKYTSSKKYSNFYDIKKNQSVCRE